jgi:hypothetical protein
LGDEEKMQTETKKVINGIYVLLTLGFVTTLISPTINYLHFYKAIEKFSISVLNFKWQLHESRVYVEGLLIISNPEEYSGLRIRTLYYNFWFANSSDNGLTYYVTGKHETFGNTEIGMEINSKSNITVPFKIISIPLTVSDFETLQMLHRNEQLVWIIDGSAWVWTFLGEPLQIFFPKTTINE